MMKTETLQEQIAILREECTRKLRVLREHPEDDWARIDLGDTLEALFYLEKKQNDERIGS